ncbi:UdgX family uracil-DNA binding protein [Ciceribacter thiooxidans]|uniref:Type-4 uracil-DNA glycosylase n=1 Tax=Ciceribacter thiooxidans TaxID=1969821 RepID=A0ABV7IAN6_9HYPH|nr:UdgX family uracil-DNA binding protein [Ciceribacter thiooxidans]
MEADSRIRSTAARQSRHPAAGPALTADHANAPSLAALGEEASGCKRCDLYRDATRLVFGEGPRDARVVLVGEQPGDREDIAGRPFVGPAGRVLDECLAEAGVDRNICYVTNAVKHFKFTQRGKRRLHSRPNAGEVRACAWWLGAELDVLRPTLVVALGATAAYALLGNGIKVTAARGQVFVPPSGPPVLVTIHPSYLLRVRGHADVAAARDAFVEDLRHIAEHAGNP